MHATERRGRSMEATATETAAASNGSRPATTAAAAAITITLRLPDEGRARKKRDPIEFSFHDLDFLCLLVWLFLKFIISLA
jgi:hypothetical protein